MSTWCLCALRQHRWRNILITQAIRMRMPGLRRQVEPSRGVATLPGARRTWRGMQTAAAPCPRRRPNLCIRIGCVIACSQQLSLGNRMRRIKGRIQAYLHRAFRHVVPMRWLRVSRDKSVSVILLLREAHVFTEEEIRGAAERAWGLSFWSTCGSNRRITVSENTVFLQAGPHLLSFRNQPHPYEEKPEDHVDWLPSLSQQKAWAEHRACCWINYLTATTDLELAHCVIAKVAAQLLDGNCTGVYFPSEFGLIPAEVASEELRNMGAYRSSVLVSEW